MCVPLEICLCVIRKTLEEHGEKAERGCDFIKRRRGCQGKGKTKCLVEGLNMHSRRIYDIISCGNSEAYFQLNRYYRSACLEFIVIGTCH